MNPTLKPQTFNHLVPFDFDNITTLPDSHAWSTTTLPSDNPCDHAIDDGKPLLHVIDFGKPGACDLVSHACEKWGVFQVINHGVSLSLFHETEFQARRLFSLPTERKMLVGRPASGTTGYGLARISPFFPKLMWSEGFGIMGSPAEHACQLWPQDHAKFWYERYFAC